MYTGKCNYSTKTDILVGDVVSFMTGRGKGVMITRQIIIALQ